MITSLEFSFGYDLNTSSHSCQANKQASLSAISVMFVKPQVRLLSFITVLNRSKSSCAFSNDGSSLMTVTCIPNTSNLVMTLAAGRIGAAISLMIKLGRLTLNPGTL